MSIRPTALVTGPTAGIGRAFAELLASEGYDLILVSRDQSRLAALAAELGGRFGISCEVLAADLSDRSQLARVESRLADSSQPVDVLVNNAGFGVNQRFAGGDLAAEQYLLDVLAVAVMRLSHAAVAGMRDRGRGDVVVVSSVAGFIAGSTYSAVKAWATVFAESLNNELRGSGVRVSALCPGFTRTEFHTRANLEMGWLPSFMWLLPDALVAKGWRDHRRGRVVSVPGWQYRFLVGLIRVVPRGAVRRLGFRARHGRDGRGPAVDRD